MMLFIGTAVIGCRSHVRRFVLFFYIVIVTSFLKTFCKDEVEKKKFEYCPDIKYK